MQKRGRALTWLQTMAPRKTIGAADRASGVGMGVGGALRMQSIGHRCAEIAPLSRMAEGIKTVLIIGDEQNSLNFF